MSIPLGTGTVPPGPQADTTQIQTQPQVQGQPAPQTTVQGGIQTTTTETPLPLTEQPIQDQLIPAANQPPPQVPVYAASAQGPVLTKPLDQQTDRPEKKVEKEGTGNTSQTQSQDGSTVQVGGEHKTHHGQQEDSGGQSGSGSGGGSSGSDSGSGSGSGGFSGGGSGGNSRRGTDGTVQVGGSVETDGTDATIGAAQTASVNGQPEDTLQAQQTAYLEALDPTGTATISESGLYSPPANGAQFFDNGGKIMQEIMSINLQFAKNLPNGPDNVNSVNYLLDIQNALMQFQQLLRELQLNDSKGAKDRSQAQLEETLQKLEEQRKQQADMDKKTDEAAKKAKILGPLAIVFAFLLVILLIVLMTAFLAILVMTFPPLGAMVIPLIAAEFLDQCATAVGQKPFAIQAIATAIMTVIDTIVHALNQSVGGSDQTEKNLKAAFKIITVAVIMAVCTALAPGFMVFGGCSTLLSFLSASHCVKAAAMAAGEDEAEADKAEMYAGIAVGAVFAIASFAIAFVLPVGGAADAVATFVKTFAQQAAEFLQKTIAYCISLSDSTMEMVGKTAQAIVRAVMSPENWMEVTGLGLQTTNAVTTYNYQRILADIALIQGRMDSDIELKDSTIQMLKKMIKQLIDGLGEISDDMGSIAQSLKKMHKGVSEITGNLFG